MDISFVAKQLDKNKNIIYNLLAGSSEKEYRWKQADEKWNLLTIICHLYDEERDDFRTRFKNVIERPDKRPPSFDPIAWITEREYEKQNFEEKLALFLMERDKSISYLNNLKDPNLNQGYQYKDYGLVDGTFFLANWLSHDYLHIKQITRLKYDYVTNLSNRKVDYAGTWT